MQSQQDRLLDPSAEVTEILQPTPERSRSSADSLTSRERMIVSYLIRGWSNREVGQQLSITEQAVKAHLQSIYFKLGVSDLLELALYAVYERLELPPVNTSTSP
jgi:DNA-binding NarL/FixJ family response regulator